jgi:uncharacterized protein (DUF488 family)
MADAVWTVGHSTRSIDDFIAVLETHAIEILVDVRRFPGSRRLPQFNSSELATAIARNDIGYRWLGELGGRRTPDPDSPNDAWEHPAFRGYADYTATDEFASGLFELLMLAHGAHTAIMCAELLWWRCHRRIIADVLVSLGYDVGHIRDTSAAEPHRLAPPAHVAHGTLTWSSPQLGLDLASASSDDDPPAFAEPDSSIASAD